MEGLYGRKQIFVNQREITRDNVVDVIAAASTVHDENATQITYLYNFYRGQQDILGRKKVYHDEINNKVVENRANEIVTFKVGYLVGEEVQYISASNEKNVNANVIRLNDFMEYNSRATTDVELIEWCMIAGVGYEMVLPVADAAERAECPFELVVLDPREAFVIRSNDVAHKVLCGVTFAEYTAPDSVVVGKTRTARIYRVYTPTRVFTVDDGKVTAEEPNLIGRIPLVEYPANSARLGVFEPVVSLLNSINTIDSNRLDGIEQFIQSLLVLVNAELDDGENAQSIREKGMIILKSLGENRADVKIIAEELNQQQTQTLKDDLYNAVLTICSMPSRNSNDSGSNGIAIVYRDGWSAAETAAKASEAMYKKSDRELRKVMFSIINGATDMDIKLSDVVCKFTRRSYENIETKSQTLISMLNNDKIDPRYAYTACGLFVDPEEAYTAGMEYYNSTHKTAEDAASEEGDAGTQPTGEYIRGYYRQPADE